jgi:lipopolysaccharide biosynthesis protein
MPFLICWANENWTRSWDGLNKDILIKQDHNLDDDLNFIEEISPMLVDDRYFKIDDKPVILIYRTDLWQDIKKTTSIWRSYMHKRFNKEIYLIKCHTWLSYQNPYDLGFDAAYQFPPHLMDLHLSNYLQWKDFVKMQAHFKLFRGVMTGFDNRARKKEDGYVFLGSSPDSYGKWLEEAISYTQKHFEKEEQLIFINAWNEWGEGAVLEPSNHWGRSYLEITSKSKFNI